MSSLSLCCACGMCVCVSSIFFLVAVEASPYLNSWDHSLPELGFRVHDPASGVSQVSIDLTPSWTCLVRGTRKNL